jgi:hypothetical protein
VAAALAVDPAVGLTAARAAELLAANGPNALPEEKPKPGWRRFPEQYTTATRGAGRLLRAAGTSGKGQARKCASVLGVLLGPGEARCPASVGAAHPADKFIQGDAGRREDCADLVALDRIGQHPLGLAGGLRETGLAQRRSDLLPGVFASSPPQLWSSCS